MLVRYLSKILDSQSNLFSINEGEGAMKSYVFLPIMEEDEAGSRVTLLGGSAGMSE